jgi:hypothetical protein
MRRFLRGRGAVLRPVLLVAGAAAAAIALNFVLLGYASAGPTDPLGRLRPQFGSGASPTGGREGIARERAREKPQGGGMQSPPVGVASSAAAARTPPLGSSDDSVGVSGTGAETEPEPGEADDD